METGLSLFDPTMPLGRAIRLPLRLIPPSTVLPVFSGPNRGRRWIVGSCTHGCWIGHYERQEVEWFLDRLEGNDMPWDIGANAGYYTLALAARCREVVACEPLPINLVNLQRHIAMNGVTNVHIVKAAIAEMHGSTIAFGGLGNSSQARIGGGNMLVPVESIDHLVASGHPAPTIVKMDVEGAESRVLQGAEDTIERHRPRLLIALHGVTQELACRHFLQARGYTTTMLNIATLWATPS